MRAVKSDSRIAILMATYNGEKYLSQQIESILRQTYTDWHLFVHDDGSCDNTADILNHYVASAPGKITILNYTPQGGACNNFMSMMRHVEADYYMFADQDDVWIPEKIEMSMDTMASAEGVAREEPCPIVVHSDLSVVDAALRETHSSLWQYMDIYPEFVQSFHDCVICYVTGCTMLFNRAARDLSLMKPHTKATMHDSWIVGCCHAAGGKVIGIPAKTVLYRQHGNNTLGAVAASRLTLMYRLRNFLTMQRTNWTILSMLRSIAPFSLLQFISAKIRYKRYITEHKNL